MVGVSVEHEESRQGDKYHQGTTPVVCKYQDPRAHGVLVIPSWYGLAHSSLSCLHGSWRGENDVLASLPLNG
jgi:hypothetical protein